MRLRLLTPVVATAAVVAVATLSHAMAAPSSPRLPPASPLALAEKISRENAAKFSGTVKLSVDIGLPRLPKVGTDGGADPLRLLSGDHVVQVATDTSGGVQRERVALMDTLSEYDAVRNGSDLWLWDSTRQLARHGSVDALTAALLAIATPAQLAKTFTGPAAIQTALFDTGYSTRKTTQVAGRDCYLLQITPNQDGTTIGEVQLAVDASTGMPLSVAVYPVHSSKPAIKAEFTSLAYTSAASDFHFVPPPGAQVIEELPPQLTANPFRGAGQGWTAAVALAGFDPDKVINGLGSAPGAASAPPEGTAAVLAALAGTPGTPLQSYLRMMMVAGDRTAVGVVWSSRLVSLVFTPDKRLYAAFATPGSLIATVRADESRGGVRG